jgi:hypothetical protein
VRCRQGQADRRRQDTVANAYHQIAGALHLLAVLRVIDVPPENNDELAEELLQPRPGQRPGMRACPTAGRHVI